MFSIHTFRASTTTSRRIYLDHASSTPLDLEVSKKIFSLLKNDFGNPSAIHSEGVRAHSLLESAREQTARALDCHSDEIIFTSGGTESDNLAIRGIVRATNIVAPHIITTSIEHSASLETCRELQREGVRVTYLPVYENGIVRAEDVEKAITKDTILVNIMYANNEIGTIQPIREIAKVIRHARKNFGSVYPFLHTDACQAVNYLPLGIPQLGVDLMTLGSSKIYGPKGVGMLYVRRLVPFSPVFSGGNQEMNRRPGTENVPLIVGAAFALEKTVQMREAEHSRLRVLQEFLFSELKKRFPNFSINGDEQERLPNNLNVSFPHIKSELLVIELDARGIAVSSKSACKSDDPEESHVLAALGKNSGEVGSIRISMGRQTKKKDLIVLLEALENIFAKYAPFEENLSGTV